jgi:porin
MHTRFSSAVRAYDSDLATYGMPGPVRDYETNLELTYQAQIISGWTVQPTLQWIWHPNGVAGRDATVVGLRSVWRY